jgi:glucose-6-phosphate dehydrogenase assembly protein OpcA
VEAHLMDGACDMVWSAERTTPADVEIALRTMLVDRHGEHAGCIPARTLNLVCVVDARAHTELVQRLHAVRPSHASRTIVCSVEPQRTEIGAVARIDSDAHPPGRELSVLRETVVLALGERHLPHLESVVDPLVVPDLPTVIWGPHGHDDALRALLALSQVVLLDSIDDPAPSAAMRRARGWLEQVGVVDLAWLRTTPWRERVASTFDPEPLQEELDRIEGVAVRHHSGSAAAALLIVGWLAALLDWRLSPLERRRERLEGRALARRGDVRIMLAPSPQQQVFGLAGMTLETGSGRRLSLDRAPGGLHAYLRDEAGVEREWTLIGASRGEPGILGEGIRHALLRDGVYDRALAAASTLAADL